MSLRNSTLTLLLLLLCALAHGQDVVFTTTEWDFGTIKEADGAIEHDFLFRNSSKKPVRIGAASLSCNCVQAFYSRDEIPPGGTGTITVRLSPEGAAGPTRRYADIYSLEGKHLGRLVVSANVTPVDIAIEERYRNVLDNKLRSQRGNISFGYVQKGKPSEKEFYLANISDKTIVLKTEATSSLSVDAPGEIPPKGEVSVKVRIDPVTPFRRYEGELRFTVDGSPAKTAVPVSAIILGDEPASKASLWTLPSEGRMKGGKCTIEIGNRGTEDLKILGVEIPDGVTADIHSGTTVPPGGKMKLKVSSKTKGTFSISLFTNDPVRPYKELRFITQ
ncbi:MAG: DUF1573 domain-containing protein [Bacteroidales bacterium]|nr:DUF1573 domain-containing protein [Bacteroidales bacterium]